MKKDMTLDEQITHLEKKIAGIKKIKAIEEAGSGRILMEEVRPDEGYEGTGHHMELIDGTWMCSL